MKKFLTISALAILGIISFHSVAFASITFDSAFGNASNCYWYINESNFRSAAITGYTFDYNSVQIYVSDASSTPVSYNVVDNHSGSVEDIVVTAPATVTADFGSTRTWVSGDAINVRQRPAGTVPDGSLFLGYDNGSGYCGPIMRASIDGYYPPPPQDLNTRFITVAPTASSTVSTSTPVTVGGMVYISENDYIPNVTTVKLFFYNQTAALGMGFALEAFEQAYGDIEIPVTNSGYFHASTTKTFNISTGKINATYQIVNNECGGLFGISFCGDTILNATTTYFYQGEKTNFDRSQENGNLGIFGLAAGSDAFDGEVVNAALDCNIGVSFDVYKCLWSFFIPNDNMIKTVLQQYRELPVVGWPIRFIDILVNTQSTGAIPDINYVFSNNNTFVGGVDIHFDLDRYLQESKTLVDDEFVADNGGGNIWDIALPPIRTFVTICLLFLIISRIIGADLAGTWATTESVTKSKTEVNPKTGVKETHAISSKIRRRYRLNR